MSKRIAWYGEHQVPEGRMVTLTVGRLALSIAHRHGEWRLGWYRNDDKTALPQTVVGPVEEIVTPDTKMTIERFLTKSTDPLIRLVPLLADRPIVSRPEIPLMIPAGDEATIFVSTPLWLRAELLNPTRSLLEIPTSRSSDTWFGPDTRNGSVAYASQTSARLSIDNLPTPAHRAITKVTVRNQAQSTLPLERLSVPAPNLRLFASPDGSLWTESLVVVREHESTPSKVDVLEAPPQEAENAKVLTEPREVSERTVLSRALRVLIG